MLDRFILVQHFLQLSEMVWRRKSRLNVHKNIGLAQNEEPASIYDCVTIETVTSRLNRVKTNWTIFSTKK
jgi:hypothetical protein